MWIKKIVLILLTILAIGFAVYAQYLFEHGRHSALPIFMGVAACLLAGILSRLAFLSPPSNFDEQMKSVSTQNSPPFPLFWVLGSVVSILVMLLLQYLFGFEDIYWLLVLLWITGMILLAAPGLKVLRISKPHVHATILLLGMISIFFLLRLHDLTVLPASFHVDEGVVGMRSRAIAGTGNERLVFESQYYNLPNFCFVVSVITQSIFGNTIFGVRFSSVLVGTVSFLGLYLLVNLLFDRLHAFIVMFFAGVSYTHLHFSRLAGPYIFPVAFGTFIAYFLFKSMIKHRYPNAIISGLVTGIALQTYNAARVLPVIIILFFILRIPFSKMKKACIQILIMYMIACFVGMAPMIMLMVKDFSGFMIRNQEVSIFSGRGYEHSSKLYHTKDRMEILNIQTKRMLGAFHVYPDSSVKFGCKRPFLDPLSGVLFFLGLGILLFRITSPPFLFLFIWFILIFIGGGVITTNAPFFPRIAGILPPVLIMLSFMPAALYVRLKSVAPLRKIILPEFFIIAIFSLSTYFNLSYYFMVYPEQYPMDTASGIAHFVKNMGQKYDYYFMTTPQFPVRHRTILYITGLRIRKHEMPDPTAFLCSKKKLKNMVFILNPYYNQIIPFMKKLFPGAEYSERGTSRYPFYTFLIKEYTPPNIDECPERTIMKKENNRWVVDKTEPVIAVMYSHGGIFGNDNTPKKIVWKGKIRLDTPGIYNFLPMRYVEGKFSIFIDGKSLPVNKVKIESETTGWHPFECIYESGKTMEAFWLGWITPSGEPQMIPPDCLAGTSALEESVTFD